MTVTTDREVLTVLDDLYQAWADHDADAFVSSFAADATSVLPGSYSVGPAATRDRMAAVFAGPLKGSRTRDEVLGVRYLGDDAAIVNARTAVLLAGQTEVADGAWVNATWTLARQDGRWLIAAYHNCPA
ncbi:SgcJ/EcaC family oxidoreductase [Cellulomonas sp. McL0617]|uniref:SgcJ/EcaC family oxidoreductase n=1 Tax=Cellulomonas sp. McL0617 TaxID=3415675 RepID=UPI003CFA36D8